MCTTTFNSPHLAWYRTDVTRCPLHVCYQRVDSTDRRKHPFRSNLHFGIARYARTMHGLVHAETEVRALGALEEQPIDCGRRQNARGTRAVSKFWLSMDKFLQHHGRSTPTSSVASTGCTHQGRADLSRTRCNVGFSPSETLSVCKRRCAFRQPLLIGGCRFILWA